MGRIANVYFDNRFAGSLTEVEDEYKFTYHTGYLAGGTPLSFNLPLQEDAFVSAHSSPRAG